MKRVNFKLFIIPTFFFFLCGVWIIFGLTFNVSSSLPTGLYRHVKDKPSKGQIVSFCLENEEMIKLAKERHFLINGNCPGGLSPLLKIVYGIPGDVIKFDNEKNIIINDTLLINSKPLIKDSDGNILPPPLLQPMKIPQGKILLLALNRPNSFDGRYWGLQSINNVKVVKPVLISSNGQLK